MFGKYDVPLNISQESISISIEREGESLRYRRECLEEKVEKMLLANQGNILINPVEPLIKPKELTPYLLIEFEKALLVEPKATKKVYVIFPIETGVFISQNEDFKLFDAFTLMKQKYTLYGDPRSGFICKYWRSEVYSSMPPVNLMNEGVIELNIINTTNNWSGLTKTGFNSYGMKIYYNDTMVSMRANMRIMGEETADTDFIDFPIEEGMKKSLELYTARKLSVTGTKFVMEVGI